MAKIVSFSKWIDGEQHVVYPQTHENVVLVGDESTTLKQHLDALEAKMVEAGLSEEEVVALVKDEISKITGENVDEAFDTIKEIADWIINHQDLYETLVGALADKVDKVDGKGLSTNDLTDEILAMIVQTNALTEELDGKLETITTADVEAVTSRQYVTQAEKEKISASARVLTYTETEGFPSGATEQDLVIQVLGDI